MTNFIPIFPLAIVVYPGEILNLHIFEERYKQLITDCYAEKKPFGIPSVIKSNVSDIGCLLEITEIVEVYPDGKMDIRVQGLGLFRILEIVKQVPDKLFSGAIVKHLQNQTTRRPVTMLQLLLSIRELHKLLHITKDFKQPDESLSSYDVAHHAGLSLEQEYELQCLLREDQRLEYLKRHIQNLLPMLLGVEHLKDKIKLNGHFRELEGFNFDT